MSSDLGGTRYRAAVITVSDGASRGERTDTSGPALVELVSGEIWDVVHTEIVPDERAAIEAAIARCADELGASLILTTGGTGLAARDVTPEAVLSLIDREVPGIPEAMRAASMKVTDRACLSRSVAGTRGRSLVIALPGSKKAAVENLSAVLSPLRHAMEIISSDGSADCAVREGRVEAVCSSEATGTVKTPAESVTLVAGHGVEGDAHAGSWHRQVSLLAAESVAKAEAAIGRELEHGSFAENILTSGIVLHELPVGTRLRVGSALLEVTQIGKECHAGCAIKQLTGDCVMPREGIFAKVLEGGVVRPGDAVGAAR